MSRTQRSGSGDLGQLDGHIFLPVTPSNVLGGTVDFNTNNNTPGTILSTANTVYTARLLCDAYLVRRYGMQDDLQQQFGSSQPVGAQGLQVGQPTTIGMATSTAGANVSVTVLSSSGFTSGQWCMVDVGTAQEMAQINAIPDATHIQFVRLKNPHTTPFTIAANIFTTPAGVSGSPPFSGVSQFVPVTSPRPKGIQIKQLNAVYQIAGSPALFNQILFQRNIYTNAAAPVFLSSSNFLLQQNAPNDAAGQFYVTPVPVPAAFQGWLTPRTSQITLVWVVQTGTTGTALLIGIWMDVNFNFN